MASFSAHPEHAAAARIRSLALLLAFIALLGPQPGCRAGRSPGRRPLLAAFRPVAATSSLPNEPSPAYPPSHFATDAAELLLPPPQLDSRASFVPDESPVRASARGAHRWSLRGVSERSGASSWPDAIDELLARADQQAAADDPACVDNYYQAAILTASAAAKAWSADRPSAATQEIRELHARALTDLLVTAQRHGRLDLHRGLLVYEQAEAARIPVRFLGLPWRPEDFGPILPAEGEETSELGRHYASEGLGAPLVVQRPGVTEASDSGDEVEPHSFFARHQTFPVTAVLRAGDDEEALGVLEFYNPYTQTSVALQHRAAPLARDLSAPLAVTARSTPRQYWRGFTAPTDVSVRPRVLFAEPYQRGKIPVLFIHGLYSDPVTWIDMLNELKSEPDICERYQLWFYRYPTGAGLLESVARLREQLQAIRDQFDPEHSDPAFDQMVLVGHSMGGLAAKLMVTNSEEIVWRQMARGPFERLKAPTELKMHLARNIFFEAQPYVTRVVFIATPHRGSAMARRLAGKLGAQLVRVGGDMNWSFRTLLEDNEHLFREEFTTSLPTSVDLLEPSSPVLRALARMSIDPQVRTHSIIGTDNHLLQEPGDGVVSIESARHAGVLSEEYVAANHEKVHRHPDATDEVLRILRMHAAERE